MSGFARLIIAVLVLVLSFLAGYYFLVMPVQKEIEFYAGKGWYEKGCFTSEELPKLLRMDEKQREQILRPRGILCQLKLKKEELKVAEKALDDWEKAVTDFKAVLQDVQREMVASPERFISTMLKDLTTLINELKQQDSALTLNNIQFGPVTKEVLSGDESPQGFTILSVTVRMSMNGHYSTVIKFMDELGKLKLKKMVKIGRISLSPTGALEPGVSPVLRVSLTMKAFVFQGGD